MSKCPEKAIVFDLGNVLLSFDFQIAANKIAQNAQMGADDIVKLIDQSKLLHQFERGEISSKAFYKTIAVATQYEKDFDHFQLDFSNIFEEIHPMIEFFRHLKNNGFKVVLFSNTNEMATEFIRKRYKFFEEFDAIFLSYQHGLMKPTPALYRIVEHSLKHTGRELFFIDDRSENIEAALGLGWSGIIHAAPETTKNAVNTWLTA